MEKSYQTNRQNLSLAAQFENALRDGNAEPDRQESQRETGIIRNNTPVRSHRGVPISASRGIGEPTKLDQERGKSMAAFHNAAKGRKPGIHLETGGSEQVKGSKPKLELKPSPRLARNVAAATHKAAMRKDNSLSREERSVLLAIAKGLRDRTPQGQGQENENGLGQGGNSSQELER